MENKNGNRTRGFFHTSSCKKMNYRWGVWFFDEERLGLQHKNGTYFIDLKRYNSPLEILGTLAHLCQSGKDLAYGKTAHGDLLKAFNEIFYLEEHMVGWNPLKNFDAEKLLRGYVRRFHEECPDSRLHRYRWREVGMCNYRRYSIPPNKDKKPRRGNLASDKTLSAEWEEYLRTPEPIYIN